MDIFPDLYTHIINLADPEDPPRSYQSGNFIAAVTNDLERVRLVTQVPFNIADLPRIDLENGIIDVELFFMQTANFLQVLEQIRKQILDTALMDSEDEKREKEFGQLNTPLKKFLNWILRLDVFLRGLRDFRLQWSSEQLTEPLREGERIFRLMKLIVMKRIQAFQIFFPDFQHESMPALVLENLSICLNKIQEIIVCLNERIAIIYRVYGEEV